MPLKPDRNFEAEMDLDTLTRARDIGADPSRLARAKDFARRQSEKFAEIARGLGGRPPKEFDGAVAGSRMKPGGRTKR